MTRAALETTRATLEQSFALVYQTAEANLADLSPEVSLARPEGGGHCANWILGHLVKVHNGVMEVLGEDPVWEDERLDRVDRGPIEGPDDALDWEALRERFLGSRERCLAAVRGLTDEELEERLTDPFGEETSRAGLLASLAFHQAYHVGQLGLARRVAGLPGAVRGPGQDG
jgi:uncharacterized damage-inducible protein DinB